MTRSRDTIVVTALASIVGERHLLIDNDVLATYETDWTGRFRGHARCVVRPADTGEVAAVVRVCSEHEVAIVAQGGNTGLVGSGVPRSGEVVLSMRRLNQVSEADPAGGGIVAGAGATLAAVQTAARNAGFDFGVDLAARDSATIGGMVATNAGGIHVLRHGMMRNQLIGAEAVLADGSIVGSVPRTVKANTGYDLAAILCGSEGTLGLVTRVQLRLVPRPRERAAALLGIESPSRLAPFVAALRSRLSELNAVEFIDDAALDLVCHHRHLPAPLPNTYPLYVLVECAGDTGQAGHLAAAVEALGIDTSATAVADSEPAVRELWEYREAVSESVNSAGIPHKFDIAIRTSDYGDFLPAVRKRIHEHAPGAMTVLFGHAGDGNVHINVLGAIPGDENVVREVLQLVAEFQGSISAEHGIGIAKAPYLELTHTDDELALQRRIKAALDPAGLLNPGVLGL